MTPHEVQLVQELRFRFAKWARHRRSQQVNIDVKSQKRVRTPENITAVAESVCEAPSTSIHRRKFCIKTFV